MYILDVQTKGDCFGFAAAVVRLRRANTSYSSLFVAIDEDVGAIIASVDLLQGGFLLLLILLFSIELLLGYLISNLNGYLIFPE